MPAWEYCEFKYVKLRGVIREVKQWQAHKSTPSGSTIIIAKSDEFEYRFWDDERSHELYEKAYRQLVAQLTIAGWEPVTYRGNGKIESMKRQVDGGNTDSMTNNSNNAAELLKQLDNLRSAGIITEDEFKTKVTEILKREVLKRG